MDQAKYENVVKDAGKQLQQFCRENPDGPPSLACFIIVALCPLSRRWLFMEQTAQGVKNVYKSENNKGNGAGFAQKQGPLRGCAKVEAVSNV